MYLAPFDQPMRTRRSLWPGLLFTTTSVIAVTGALGYAFLMLQQPADYAVQTALREIEPPAQIQNASLEVPASQTRAYIPSGLAVKSAAGTTSEPYVQVAIKVMPDPATASTGPAGAPGGMNRIAPAGNGGAAGNEAGTATTPAAKPPELLAQGSTSAILGPFRIQIGAFRSPEAAQDRWFALRKSHRDVLGRLIMVIERVNLGRRGVVYRLQAGPLKTREAVRSKCQQLGKRQIRCTLVEG